MPVIRSPNEPHSFSPRIAKHLGIVAAVVEYAFLELSRGQDATTKKEVVIPVELSSILKRCSYFSKEEVLSAIQKLQDLNLIVENE